MARRGARGSTLACNAESIRATLGSLRPPSEDLVERLRLWTELLQQWSAAQRLVGWRRSEDLLLEGLLDAWAAVPLLASSDPDALIDLGSGAGLPAVVLAAAYPSRDLHLVEARRKRAAFLSASVRALELTHVVVHHARIEELSSLGRLPTGAVVTARAFAAPAQVLAQAEVLQASHALLSIGQSDQEARWPAPWRQLQSCPGSPSERRVHVLLGR
jgi:16S rRNA (guanine527-N7)-methyltransferase